MKLPAAIITISDSCHRGLREDLSGPRLQRCLAEAGFEIVQSKIIPDEAAAITSTLRDASKHARFVVTTGGTGISARDLTPEATCEVCDRLIDGIPELMRSEGRKHTPMAALSRGVCGSICSSLVLNLPGSPAGAEQSLALRFHRAELGLVQVWLFAWRGVSWGLASL